MRLRRVREANRTRVEVSSGRGWLDLRTTLQTSSPPASNAEADQWSADIVSFLAAPARLRASVARALRGPVAQQADSEIIIPFEPRSYRDFMLYEQHAIASARGYVRTFMPRVAPVLNTFEKVSKRTFPALKPKPLWYRQPVYYMGNHLAFVTSGAAIACPSYTRALDYELELGFVLVRAIRNASPEEAEAAIGGFVVLNDFTARDVQRDEMSSGFGPQKSKHFANAISSEVVTADEILPRWRELEGYVKINGDPIAQPSSAGAHWSLGEALAHASRSEQLHPGEFFATGTFPGGSGIEIGRFLSIGDTIDIGIGGVGSLVNTIVAEEGALA